MDRIRRLTDQILERYKDMFTTDYEKNKEVLSKVAVIRSKRLRNQIAGRITTLLKEEQAGVVEPQIAVAAESTS